MLRLAARHDRALGEEFLSKLKIETAQAAENAEDKVRSNRFQSPEAQAQTRPALVPKFPLRKSGLEHRHSLSI